MAVSFKYEKATDEWGLSAIFQKNIKINNSKFIKNVNKSAIIITDPYLNSITDYSLSYCVCNV